MRLTVVCFWSGGGRRRSSLSPTPSLSVARWASAMSSLRLVWVGPSWSRQLIYIYLSIYISIHLSIHLSIYLSIHLSIYLSIDIDRYRYRYIWIYICRYIDIYRYVFIHCRLRSSLSPTHTPSVARWASWAVAMEMRDSLGLV